MTVVLDQKGPGCPLTHHVRDLIKLRARGERIAQVGVTHYPRAAGTNTGASFRKILRTFRDIGRLRWALWTRRREVLGTRTRS